MPLHRTRRVNGRRRRNQSRASGCGWSPSNLERAATERARDSTHTRACMCVAMAPVCKHRLGQVSDKARSRQVLRGLSACVRFPLALARQREREREREREGEKLRFFLSFFSIIQSHAMQHAERIAWINRIPLVSRR